MTKFQPYRGCNCGWCKGNKQRMSNRGSKKYRFFRQYARRKFRRTAQNIGLDYEMPTYISTERWS